MWMATFLPVERICVRWMATTSIVNHLPLSVAAIFWPFCCSFGSALQPLPTPVQPVIGACSAFACEQVAPICQGTVPVCECDQDGLVLSKYCANNSGVPPEPTPPPTPFKWALSTPLLVVYRFVVSVVEPEEAVPDGECPRNACLWVGRERTSKKETLNTVKPRNCFSVAKAIWLLVTCRLCANAPTVKWQANNALRWAANMHVRRVMATFLPHCCWHLPVGCCYGRRRRIFTVELHRIAGVSKPRHTTMSLRRQRPCGDSCVCGWRQQCNVVDNVELAAFDVLRDALCLKQINI